MTWWLFDEAAETARTGLEQSRRADPLEEARFLRARAALWYLLERFDEADAELQAALRIAYGTTVTQGSSALPIRPVPLIQFACHYLEGKIAGARRDWDQVLATAEKAAALTNVAKLPRYNELLLLLRIDALLQRNRPNDNEAAHDLTTSLSAPVATIPYVIGWSDCVQLAQARDAARMRLPDAEIMLRRALNTLEENANRALLETDRAFLRLAEAATELGDSSVANHASARAKYYRSGRLAAAGALWGGMTPV
jgi:tetratricopeptide (TPR) repeat protein